MLGFALALQRAAQTEHGAAWSSPNLSSVPASFGGWRSENRQLDAVSRSLLEPDAVLWRTYVDPAGVPLDFLVVYGHRKKTFHSPGFCLPGGGWEIVSKRTVNLDLQGGNPRRVCANLFEIQNQGRRQIALYWFAHRGGTTPSLIRHNLGLMCSRVAHQRATGALVRVLVPVLTTEDDAIRRAVLFLKRVYPEASRQIAA